MAKVLNLGVIGCGDISTTWHIPTIVKNKEVNLYSLCDIDLSRAKRLGEQYGVTRIYDNYAELLEDKDIDAVIVATPPWETPNITIEALKNGKYVLCEKPMALDVKTAERVREVEEKSRAKVQVGFTYVHDPVVLKLKQWIDDGRLGTPLMFRFGVYDETYDPQNNPEHYHRIMKTMKHGSPTIHDGAHTAAYIGLLIGKAKVIDAYSFGFKSKHEFPCSNYDISILRLDGGDMAKLEIGWFFPTFPGRQFEVLGPDGFATYDWINRYAEIDSITLKERYEDPVRISWWARCFDIQLATFVDSIINDKPMTVGCDDGIYSLTLTKRIADVMTY